MHESRYLVFQSINWLQVIILYLFNELWGIINNFFLVDRLSQYAFTFIEKMADVLLAQQWSLFFIFRPIKIK